LGRCLSDLESRNIHLQRAMTETHHRVKNSLQMIAALIEVETSAHRKVMPVGKVKAVSRTIQALAAIHDLLTEQSMAGSGTEDLSARAVLLKLLPILQAMFTGCSIRAELSDVCISARQASAVALITNELVANAAKHGCGSIRLVLTTEGERARLIVEDDGPGFPPDFSPATAAHTGLELLQSLASWDLAGEVALENRPGTGARVRVTFPRDGTQMAAA
jgi:two-component sensor histidine kinase